MSPVSYSDLVCWGPFVLLLVAVIGVVGPVLKCSNQFDIEPQTGLVYQLLPLHGASDLATSSRKHSRN